MKDFKKIVKEKPELFCTEVVNGTGAHHFESFEVAKANYTDIAIDINTNKFTSAMYNGHCEFHNKPQMRFEDWNTYNELSK